MRVSAPRDPTDMVAAGLLRQLRTDLGYTQQRMAAAVGLPQSTVSEYETGRRQPTLGTLIRVVEAAGRELRLNLDARDRHDELLAAHLPEMTAAAFAAEQQQLLVAQTARRLADKYFADIVTDIPVA